VSGRGASSEPAGDGLLVLVATPIGNLGDLSSRAVEVLGRADLICCEDTRRTRALLAHAQVTGRRLVSLHAHNEQARIAQVLNRLAAGETVALVSDAGTPAISDPGARLVAAAVNDGLTVTAVPGPSAAITALVVSGLDTGRFCVEGFLPRRGGDRRRRLEALASEERTAVLFEAPGRLAATLVELADTAGATRAVVVARELTKLHEEIWRGTVGAAAEHFATEEVRGEVVIVLGGSTAPSPPSTTEVVAALERHRRQGASWRDAAAGVAAELGVGRRRVYEQALELRRQEGSVRG